MAETIVQEIAPGVNNTYYNWEFNNYMMDKILKGFHYSREFTFGPDAYRISVSKPVAEFVYSKLDEVVYSGYTTYRFKDGSTLLSNRPALIDLLETLHRDMQIHQPLYEIYAGPNGLKELTNQLYGMLASLKGELTNQLYGMLASLKGEL